MEMGRDGWGSLKVLVWVVVVRGLDDEDGGSVDVFGVGGLVC